LVARAIAHDLGYTYIDEDNIGWIDVSQNAEGRLVNLMREQQGIVVQAPACAHLCHTFGSAEDIAVVFVMRPVKDIITSQERIDWQYEKVEIKKYPKENRLATAAETKYAYWENVQRSLIKNSFEVWYEDLSTHLLWVEDRDGFEARQWRVE